MFFPESLYLLSQRDQQTTWLDPLFRSEISSVADTAVALSFQVPIDRALLLQHALADYLAGAAQNLSTGIVEVVPPAGTKTFPLLTQRAVGTLTFNHRWEGSLVVPPSWSIVATGIFDAGAAANQLTFTIAGMLIPPANIQRV